MQARQRRSDNFYIDIVDVIAAEKVKQHQKKDCLVCTQGINKNCRDIQGGFSIDTTQELLHSIKTLKHRVIYIGGFLVHKRGQCVEADDVLSNTFFEQSNSGSFRGPTLSTVYFIHCGTTFHDTLSILRKKCGKYFAELLPQIDTSIPDDLGACRTLANLLKNVFILQTSDHEI